MDILNALFTKSLVNMDADSIVRWLQSVERVDEINNAVGDFNEAVFRNLISRHDVPAYIRVILAKYSAITTALSENLMLATDDESYIVMDRKEDA